MDAYAYWREELKAPKANSRDTNRRDLCGFYRIHKARTKPDYPVAIWMHMGDGTLHMQVSRAAPINERDHKDEWDRFFSTNWYHAAAIDEKLYRSIMDGGEHVSWPDGKNAFAVKDPIARLDPDYLPDGTAESGGSNGAAPTLESLEADIKRNLAKARALVINTQEDANAGRALQEVLNSLFKKGDALRVLEKKPHDDASAAVQAKWKPVIDPAKTAADWVRDQVDKWLKQETARLQAVAAAQAAEAERLRQIEVQRVADENRRLEEEHLEKVRLAERQAEEKAEAGEFMPEIELPPEPELIELPPAPVVTEPAPIARAGTAFGKVSKARTVVRGEIVDRDKLIKYLLDSGDAGLLDYLQNRANAAARAKLPLPGVERRED